MWNQWSQYAAVQPPLPMGAAPPPPPNEPVQAAPPPPSAAPQSQQPVMIGPVAPTPPAASVGAPTAASAAIPTAASTNPYSQYTAAQYAALTPEQQYTLQQHWQQWQKYQEEYAKWHAQYGEQYKREMEAASKTTTAAYPGFTGPVPPTGQQVDPKVSAASTTKITGQPQLYNQPPPMIGPSNQYMTAAPPTAQLPHQQPQPQQPPPPPPPSQQPPYQQQQQTPAQWQSNQSFFNQPPPNFNSANGPPNNYQNTNNPNMNNPNQWTSGPPPFGNQRSQQPPVNPYRPNEKGNSGPPVGFNDPTGNTNNSGPNNWNNGPPNNRESFGADNINRGRVGANNDNEFGRRLGTFNAPNPEDKWNEGPPPNRGRQEINDMPPFAVKNRGGNSGSNDWQQGPPNSRGRSGGPNEWRPDSKNSGNDEPEDWQGTRGNVRNRSNERDDWKGGPSTRGVNEDAPWQSGVNNRGNNNRFNDWNNAPPNNNRDGNRFNEWNDGPNSRGRRDGSNDWRDGSNSRDNNDRPNNQDFNNRSNFNSRDEDNDRDRDFGSNNRNNRFSGGVGGWNDGPNIGRNNRPNDWDNRGNNRPNNWGDDRGPNNWSDGNQGNNWNNGSSNNRGPPNAPQNQQQIAPSGSAGPAGRSGAPDIDEEKFDRQFKLWEEQFEDWKRANANHPDRDMYRRYEQEFEKQRTRITERREQMRRRKLERMGIDPNQLPPPTTNSGNNSIVGSETECKNTSRDSSRNRDISANRNLPGRNDSFAEKKADEKQPPDEEVVKSDIKEAEEEEHKDEVAIEDGDKNNKKQNVHSNPVARKDDLQEDTENASKVNANSPISIKFNVQKSTPLGKRKSRFDTSGPPVNKLKALPGGKGGNTAEVINLDDDDDDANVDDRNQENLGQSNDNMAEIFKKTDGIPGLDLVEDDAIEQSETIPEADSNANKQATSKKIPSLFDIKVDKPDMGGKGEAKDTASGVPIPDISKTLNDPEFMKKISEAVAKAKGNDERQPQYKQEDMKDASGRPLSFAEWQRYNQQQDEVPSNFEDNDNSNDNNPASDRMSMTKSVMEDDVSNERPSMADDEQNMGGPGPNDGHNNNMGPNDNNFGPNGPNNRGPNWGPNNWGPNSGPNVWSNNSGPNNNGPNGDPNNWGPNAGGPNNNWGPNSGGPNNGGPNNNWGNSGGGPNNWGNNNNAGPNNWGPNNNNRGGPWGPNSGGPNNWGNNGNGGGGGPNNWGPNNNNFGPNFRGNNNNRNFGPNFGPNGPNGPNFGPNGPNRPNFGPNGPNGPNFGSSGPNSSNFGPSGPNSPNFGPKGPNNANMGRNSPNFGPNGPNNRNFGPNNGPNFGKNTPGRNFGRDGPQNQPDNTNSAQTTRNSNNPFRRSENFNTAPSVDDDVNSPRPWMKGPGDNLDYGDYFRPVQVIDYTNNASVIAPKVIDYGHKPVVSDDFKPVKVFNYDHAPKPGNTAAHLTPVERQRRGQKRRNKRKQQRDELRKKQQQMPQNQNNTNQNQDNNVVGPSNARENEEQLEDISDTEDLHEDMMEEERMDSSPAPPPPPMYSFGVGSGASIMQAQTVPSSIFPSTAEANETSNKVVTVDHVQMSIPTVENNNTISIEEILMLPGRDTRPKKICIILRGPPGSGKSHVAKLIKEKEKEMSGNNPRVLSIDDYFLIENDYEEKCKKTGKKIPKKEILYEYDKDMEETYMQYLIKSFKKTIVDNFYDFIVIDCNNNSLRSLNEFYCHSKDSGYVPYIVDLFVDLDTCMNHNVHERTEADIKQIIDTWKPTPFHYIKLDVSSLLDNVVEMEDAEDMHVDDNVVVSETADALSQTADENSKETAAEGADDDYAQGDEDGADDEEAAEDDSNDSTENQCGFLKSKWETDTTNVNLARLDGTSKLNSKRKQTMEEYLQMDEWQPVPSTSKGKKRVRWADIEEKREQEKMRAVGFVVGQTDWKRMMDPNAAKRALNKTKYIERVNKQRR